MTTVPYLALPRTITERNTERDLFRRKSGNIDKNKVRVIHTTKPFVDYVYVARKGVPSAEQEKFVHAFLALKESENEPVLKILRAKQFVVANDEEYAKIRELAKELNIF